MIDLDFQTTSKVRLTLRPIPADTAEHFGCPGATHMLMGTNFTILGSVAEPTGKVVRVPGWSKARLGVRTVFTPWLVDVDTGCVPVTGWVGQ